MRSAINPIGFRRFAALAAALILALTMTAGSAAPAEEEAATVTIQELKDCVEALRARALDAEPLNNPGSEEAASEDGNAFIYDFATFYADATEMAADTAIRAVMITDDEGGSLRAVTVDSTVNTLLAAFASTNPTLNGTREEALIYLEGDLAGGYRYGVTVRDGQRIIAVEYGEALPEGGEWHSASVLYSLQAGMVSSIRLQGLSDPADAAEVQARYEDLAALGQKTGYTRVPTSLNGLELTAFGPEDLRFDGLYYPELQPASFGGTPEDVIMENEDGTWLRVVEGDGYNAVFSCDSEGKNAVIRSYTITGDRLEGPRGVRLGDQFHEDFNRFRNGENTTEGITELLYGTEGVAPWGRADYAEIDGGMSLHYVTALPGGGSVELVLRYLNNALTEIILHTV